MKAMVLERQAPIETRPLLLREVERPEPGDDEVLVAVSACGACHTDLHIAEGDLLVPSLPLIPGHQIVGRIETLGKGVTELEKGDRVGIPWLHRTCGNCTYCKRGDENLCTAALFTGLHRPGGYAEAVVAPAGFVSKLPDGLDDEQAAPLLCAGIIGYRALVQSGLGQGEALGLVGFGASAHIALQISLHWDCRVYVFTRSEEHRRQALALGARFAGSIDDPVQEPLGHVISFAPAGSVIPPMLEKLDRGGTLALAGIHVDRIPELDYQSHLFQEKMLTSVTASTRKDARKLLDLAAAIPIRTQTCAYPLEEANQVLRRLKESNLPAPAAVFKIA